MGSNKPGDSPKMSFKAAAPCSSTALHQEEHLEGTGRSSGSLDANVQTRNLTSPALGHGRRKEGGLRAFLL